MESEVARATERAAASARQLVVKRRRRRRGGRGRGGDHAPTAGQQTQHPLTVPARRRSLQFGPIKAMESRLDPKPMRKRRRAWRSAFQASRAYQTAPAQGRRGGSSQPSGGQQTALQAPQSNGHDRFGASIKRYHTTGRTRSPGATSHREIATPNTFNHPFG